MPGIQIGELLVERGVLSKAQVQHILAVQRMSNRPFGDLAERLYGIAAKAVEDAWVDQYVRTVGITDLEELEFDSDCLRLLNRRQAWQFHLLPIDKAVDAFQMATSTENLARSVNFTTRKFDQPVHMLIAERQQLREFLMRHYPVPEQMAEFADRLEAARA